ncbi:MAG TPA: DUF6600 domain-containing protein, partial [Kofleriaceae bacterium]|nr:DUF6600 domain-containing protein [Kofleriaceae bacterium]
ATVVGVDFTPYESGGSWQATDAGWAFACDYPWGWLPFHYGRWAWFHDYWGWVPGHRWGPAWVEWRHGGGVVGWRPMRPRVIDHRTGHDTGHEHRFGQGRPLIRDHRRAEQHDAHWRFTAVSDFGRPHVRSHLYGNLAEGLRVTQTVAAPPVRARTTVRAADLMRSRFAPGGRLAPAGRFGGPAIRDHRSPALAAPPAQAWRAAPSGPPRAYPPAIRGDSPAVRGYQAPYRGYQAPYRGYQAPYRGNPAPARATSPAVRAYPPPARWGGPPPRSYQPPARSFQPPPARSYRPSGSYSPPARSYSPPARSSSSSGSSGSSSHSSSSHSSGGSHGGGHRGR